MAQSISSDSKRPMALILALLAVAGALSFTLAAITTLHWTPAAAASLSHANPLPSLRL